MDSKSRVAQHFLRYAIGIGAIRFVPEGIKLKNGRLSPYFFDSGLFLSGRSLLKLAGAYATEMIMWAQHEKSDLRILHDAVLFGLAYKGIPLAAAIAALMAHDCAALAGNIAYAFDRKEPKDHGEGGRLIGAPLDGKLVIMVDDVITDGESKCAAVEFIRKHGGTPIACFIAFDREERGNDGGLSAAQMFTEATGVPVVSLARFSDLITLFENDPPTTSHDVLAPLLEYRAKYGASLA